MYKMKWLALVAVIAVGGIFAISMTSCEELKEACGDCGSIKTGDTTISGDAALDGFFQAVGSLDGSFGKINGEFEGNVMAMAEAFEVDGAADMELGALIDATVDEIDATIAFNLEAGAELAVDYTPPKCEVSAQASFEAQAKCEVKGGCDVDVECSGGELSFACEGKCEGSCSAGCSAPFCKVDLKVDATCSGECKGGCTFSSTATCEGECRGTCSGTCTAHNASGECEGSCNGNCTGECVVEMEGECSGSCEGECHASMEGDLTCEKPICKGECSGECSGGCEGKISAPKCEGSAECSASAECEAQASAQASASASCTPPSLDIAFEMKSSLDPQAQAKFRGQMKVFKESMINIMQGMANLRILFDANAAAEIGIEPPAIELKAKFEDLVEASLDGDFDIAPGLIGCTIDGVEETVDIVGSIGGKMKATVEGQAQFAAILF